MPMNTGVLNVAPVMRLVIGQRWTAAIGLCEGIQQPDGVKKTVTHNVNRVTDILTDSGLSIGIIYLKDTDPI